MPSKIELQKRAAHRLEKEKSELKISTYWNDNLLKSTIHLSVIGDSRKMSRIKDSSVHLIVTSPPYFNAKAYSHWDSIEGYLKDMRLTLKECYRVLAPGRKFCLNISDLPEKGPSGVRWVPLGPKLLDVCLNVGFEIVDRIIWNKTPAKGFQYGSLPYPPSPLICDSMEYIYILRKPKIPNDLNQYRHLSKLQKEASRLTRTEYAEFTKQIWTISRVRLKDNQDGHIAPFPDEIPLRCVRLYSFVGETILDPFGGSGTTTKVALLNKRNSVLYEIEKKYLAHIKEKIGLGKSHQTYFDDPLKEAEINIEYER